MNYGCQQKKKRFWSVVSQSIWRVVLSFVELSNKCKAVRIANNEFFYHRLIFRLDKTDHQETQARKARKGSHGISSTVLGKTQHSERLVLHTLGDMLQEHVAGTCCSDSFPRVTFLFSRKNSVAGTEFCPCNMLHDIQQVCIRALWSGDKTTPIFRNVSSCALLL